MNDRLAAPFEFCRAISWVAELTKQRWPEVTSKSHKLRIVDLYSGCGGLTLGAFQAAIELSRPFEVALAIDSSTAATDVFADNFSTVSDSILTNDISEYVTGSDYSRLSKKGRSLVDKLGKVDVLLAGPPCQGNSDLNNKSRREDPRNDLYIIPAIFASKLLPDIVLIENVPTVVHAKSEVVMRTVKVLKSSGYVCAEFRADLTALGLPQTRRRHVLVASKLHSEATLNCLLALLPCQPTRVPLGQFLADLKDEASQTGEIFSRYSRASPENQARIDHLFDNDLFDLPNSLRPPCHRDKKHSYVSMYGRLDMNEPAQTITSGFGSMGQGRFVHPSERRTITPHEAARIQGFPDYFSFKKAASLTELRQMIGNAVAPAVAFTLIATLLKNVTEEREIN